jgi:hypothetical protein
MHSAEVVILEIDRQHVFVILDLLRERIDEAGKTPPQNRPRADGREHGLPG